ncbi:MAG TPA: hypothetical protein VF982_06405 [Anaerolineales bacterium]
MQPVYQIHLPTGTASNVRFQRTDLERLTAKMGRHLPQAVTRGEDEGGWELCLRTAGVPLNAKLQSGNSLQELALVEKSLFSFLFLAPRPEEKDRNSGHKQTGCSVDQYRDCVPKRLLRAEHEAG